MNFLSRRLWLLAATAAMFAGGALGVACSNNNGFNDGGADGSNPGDAMGGDAQHPDGSSPNDGGGADVTPQSCEAGVGGECDIVQQNCASGKQCVLAQVDGGYQTECVANGNGTLPEGTACDPSGQVKCVSGLECIEKRCARHCCLGDDAVCAKSNPEGFAGKCDLNITDPNNSSLILYDVCTYNKPCAPFQIQGCGAGLTCIVSDSNGTADCSEYPNGDAGLAEKATCSSSNACNDGMGCYGAPDGGGYSCQWNCYVKNMGGPYDGQIAADAGAGYGGCPKNETCTPINWGGTLPAWFGLCQ